MNKVLYKNIKLTPTDFDIDVYVCEDFEKLAKKLKKTVCKEEDWREIVNNSPLTLTWESKEGEIKIFVFLKSLNIRDVVHEATHVTWHLDDLVNFNFNFDNQEIQAYYIDYIVGEILGE